MRANIYVKNLGGPCIKNALNHPQKCGNKPARKGRGQLKVQGGRENYISNGNALTPITVGKQYQENHNIGLFYPYFAQNHALGPPRVAGTAQCINMMGLRPYQPDNPAVS